MNEVKVCSEYTTQGNIVWVLDSGEFPTSIKRKFQNCVFKAEEFCQLSGQGRFQICQSSSDFYQFVVIYGFDHFSDLELTRLLYRLRVFSEEFPELKIFLFTSRNFLKEFGGAPESYSKANVLSFSKEQTDLNEFVHGLLFFASQIQGIKINRMSERAAHYLEEASGDFSIDELFLVLSEGVRRSSGATLRFRDLFPGFGLI